MARRQVGELEEELLTRVDACARELGQTRVEFVRRSLEAAVRSDARLRRLPGHLTSAQAKAGVKPIERPSTTTQSRKGARLKK